MKKLFFLLLVVALVAFKCEKDEADAPSLGELNISSTDTPKSVAPGQTATIRFTVTEPNLCYKLRRTEVKEKAANRFEVRAFGTVPTATSVCAQAIYTEQTSVEIKPSVKGTYYIDFAQNDRRIKTDTVVVQ